MLTDCFTWEMIHMTKATRYEEMIGVFTPFPLSGENYEEFYVDTSAVRSVMNATNTIVTNLLYGINPYMKLLFMGHKGSGKSTEIIRISEKLKDKYEIISFSMAQEVELSGIHYIDVIFVIMSQIIEYLAEHLEVKVDEKLLENLITYWKGETSFEKVITDNAEAEAGGEAKISLLKAISVHGKSVFKTGMESKKIIRSSIDPKIGYLISMVNSAIAEINEQLRSKSNKELLIIIEDLDKIDIDDARRIFVQGRKSILSLQLKMIFAFPIYMVYTADFSMIQDDFDNCVYYSMIKVSNSDRTRNEEGIAILKEIVYKRMDRNLIDDEALDYMVVKSGGAIRDLFYMLREAAFLHLSRNDGEDRISLKDAEIVSKSLKSIYERFITSREQFERLIEIYNDPFPDNTDQTLSELLKTLSVIEYNGERWCGVHPVLVDFLKEKGKLPSEA